MNAVAFYTSLTKENRLGLLVDFVYDTFLKPQRAKIMLVIHSEIKAGKLNISDFEEAFDTDEFRAYIAENEEELRAEYQNF